MKETKVRVGIIGCGGIAFEKHMPALSSQQNVDIIGFFDTREDCSLRAAREFGADGAKTYSDVDALLGNKDIDVVHVCTPSGSHADLSIRALEAGKHVMCEKPMATTSEDALRMVDTAKRTGKKLTIGFQNRFRQDSWYLKQACDRGDLGEIYFAKALAVRRRAVPVWLLTSETEQGGGPILDIGVHALDLTLWMMDNYKPKSVVGNIYNKLNKNENESNLWGTWDPKKFVIEDSAFGFITMENGATVILEASWALNTLEDGEAKTQLCGTKGGADMFDGLRLNGTEFGGFYTKMVNFDKKMKTGTRVYDFDTEAKKAYDSANAEAKSWIEAIVNDTEPVVKPEEAAIIVKILEALKTSALSGKPVCFDR